MSWLAVFLWLFASDVSAQPTTSLVALTNQVWRYNDTGADLGVAWRATAYTNDNVWRSGPGLFGVETSVPYPYPEPIRTPLVLGGGRITYYFRTHFNFSGDRSRISLFATGYVDDGAVFYLNGTEAGRVRLTNNPVTFTSRAQLANPEGVPVVLEFSTTNLVQGSNALAVEVHQASDTSADVVFGMSLEAIGSQPPSITNPAEPADRTVAQGDSTTLTVFASGFPPPAYQWFKNTVAIPGATDSSLSLMNVSAVDIGNYFVRLTNTSGNITSRTAVVTVLLDTNAPTILYALGQPNLTDILIVFSEPVNGSEAQDNFSWKVDEVGGGTSLTVLPGTLSNGTNLLLPTMELRAPDTAYVVRTDNLIEDDFGNTLPVGTEVPVALFVVVPPLIPLDDTHPWRYNQSGVDLGTNWTSPAYDDSTWLRGSAPFDAFRSPGSETTCRAVLPATGGAVGTCLTLSNADQTAQIPAVYFRTHFMFEGDAAHSVLHLESILNDGAVYYLNGVELQRLGMPEGAITYNTLANREIFEATTETSDLNAPSLVSGDNVLAVELHQFSLSSPALTLGLTLTAVLPTFPAIHPRLTISVTGGTMELNWSPAVGRVESTDDLTGSWTPLTSSDPPGQHIAPASDPRRFFRVVVP